MNVVLLHDWLVGYRGGERVLEAFCEIFPQAPIYTLIHQKGSTSPIIESRRIHTSALQYIPGITQNYRKFLPLFPLATRTLNLPVQTNLILSSSHCVIKGVHRPHGAKHLCYIHSPMRYLYDQYDVYFGPHAPLSHRLGMGLFRNYLTNWDQSSNTQVHQFVANSAFVQNRVQNLYHRDAKVIHPFVELKDFQQLQKMDLDKKPYHLMVTAFAPNKRVDLAINAFRQFGRKLVIVGSGQDNERLRAMAGPEVEFVGQASRSQIIQLLAQAQSLIFPGVEDFGITPLEALAAGTPVVAYRGGGVLETLTSKTAIFFDDPTVASLREAIEICEARQWNKQDLLARAQIFSREQFITKISAACNELLFK